MPENSHTVKGTHAVRWLIVAVLCCAIAGAAFWAGRITTKPIPLPTDAPSASLIVDVREASVGKTFSFNVTARQDSRLIATNMIPGVVTQVANSGQFNTGDTVYAVGATPVRVVAGNLAFYRPLEPGTAGADVKQLRDALVALGYARTSGTEYDASTTAAVSAWQKKLGTEINGKIALGELIAVPTLPAALVVDPKIAMTGVAVQNGEKIVSASVGTPTFVLALAPEQARLIPKTATLSITFNEIKWAAVIAGSSTTEQGRTEFELAAPGGGPVCADACSKLDIGSKEISLPAVVEVVKPISGPVIPVAAITTEPDAKTSVQVVDAQGTRNRREVKVLGSQDGLAVVDGLKVGEKVQVFNGGTGIKASQPQPQPSPSK